LVTGESILAVFSSKFSIVAVFFVRSILPIGVVCSWQCRRQQITPGEQTDHGIFGSFVQIDVGSNDGSHGQVTACPVTAALTSLWSFGATDGCDLVWSMV